MQRRSAIHTPPKPHQAPAWLIGVCMLAAGLPQARAAAAAADQIPQACIALGGREREFFAGVALLGREQVALGKLALRHASRTDVRRLAQQTVNAYMRMAAQLNTLAEAKGVILPTQLSDAQKDAQTHLAAASGDTFDALYLSLQAHTHAALTALFSTQAQGQGDRQLTTWAQNALPQLEAHGRRLAATQRAAAPAEQTAEDTP